MLRRRTAPHSSSRRRGLAAGLVATLTALGMVVTGAMESQASEMTLSSGQTVVMRSTWSPPGNQIILNVRSQSGRTKQTGVVLQSFTDTTGASYMGFCVFPFVFDDFTWPMAINNTSSYQAVTMEEHVAGTQDASGVAGNLRQIRWLMNNVPAEIRSRTASSTQLAAFEAAFWHFAENATVSPVAGVNASQFATYYQQYVAAADASTGSVSYIGFIAQPRNASAQLQSVALVPLVMPSTTRPIAYVPQQLPAAQPRPVASEPSTPTVQPSPSAPPAPVEKGRITTTAITDRAENKTFGCSATTITDIVKYTDLPQTQLELFGRLMNKGTGRDTGIMARKKFTPVGTQGEVRLDFALTDAQATKYCGTSLVVFEVVMQPLPYVAPEPDNGSHDNMTAVATSIAKHEDINSASQTVHGVKTTVKQPAPAPDTPVLPHTGANPALRLMGLAGFNMLLVGAVFTLAGQKRTGRVRYSRVDF